MAAAIGAKNFKTKYDRPAFINKNANTSGRLISLKGEKGLQYPWSKDKKDYLDVENKVKNNALTTQELSAIVDHVRAKFPKNTMYEYLIFDMGIDYSNVSVNDYIILSDEISVSKTRNSKIDKSFNGIYNCKGYDRVGTVKAIRMYDIDNEVIDLELFRYQSWDDDWCSKIFGTIKDIEKSNLFMPLLSMVRVCNA